MSRVTLKSVLKGCIETEGKIGAVKKDEKTKKSKGTGKGCQKWHLLTAENLVKSMRTAADEVALTAPKPLGKIERAAEVAVTICVAVDLLMMLGEESKMVVDTPDWSKLSFKMWHASPRALVKRVYDMMGRKQQEERHMMAPRDRQDAVLRLLTEAHTIAETMQQEVEKECETSSSTSSSDNEDMGCSDDEKSKEEEVKNNGESSSTNKEETA